MRVLFLSLALLFSLSTSSFSYASTCLTNGSSVDARNGFCITFSLESDGSNRIRLANSQYFPLWTDDDDFDGYYQQIFDEDYEDDDVLRQFQVKFERTSNYNARWISGKLTYSVDGTQKKVINNFDLSYATGADKFDPFVTITLIGDSFTSSSQYCISEKDCQPLVPRSKPLFEFGEVDASSCNRYTCSFDFDEDFKTTPVVILMSSYNTNDNPSAMFVTSVTKDRVEVKQRFPLSSDPNLMDPIYYFAAEVGDVILDESQPGKIIRVSKVELNHFQTAGDTRGEGWKRETYSQRFSAAPIVFSQVQPDSGKDFWVTTAHKNVGTSNFRLALEFGRQNVPTPTSYRRRTVGYMAAPEFSGQTSDGIRFVFNKPSSSYNQSASLAQSCIDNQVFHGQSFQDFGVIIQKQTRSGSDGGWLRLCELSNPDYFTFMLEEDASNRSHQTYERVGFFAFEEVRPKPPIQKCDYFPEMLQSNRYLPGANPGEWTPWDGQLDISSGSGTGNNIYLDQISKSEALGFTSSRVSGLGACVYKDGQNSGGSCTVSSAKNLFPLGVPATTAFNPSGGVLIAAGNNQTTEATQFNYTSLSFSANTSTVVFPAGEYWIDTINFNHNDSYIKVKGDGPVVIHYNHINLSHKSRIYINAGIDEQSDSSYDHNDFTLIGHGRFSSFWPLGGSDIRLNANVYVSPEAISAGFDINGVARFQMTGAITAPRVSFRSSDTSFIRAKSIAGCYTPPSPTIKYIEIKPNNYHLTCDDKAEVYVVPYDENSQPMSDVNGETVSISAPEVTFSGGSFDSQNKRFVFDIDGRSGNKYGDVLATASVNGTTIQDQKDISFVPYRFDIKPSASSTWNNQPLEVIAGKAEDIDVRVLACSNNASPTPIVMNYAEKLDVNDLGYVLQKPGSGGGSLGSGDFNFSKGVVEDVAIQFDNSGELVVTLEDKSFRCSTQPPTVANCPSDGGTLKGQITLKARPWKIAICNVRSGSSFNPAGGETGGGFISAGTDFIVDYKPIIHPDTALGITDECAYPVTSNYSLDSGPLDLDFKVVYPAPSLNPQPGAVTPNVIPSFSTNQVLNTLVHTWSEVGAIEFISSAIYLGRDIQKDHQVIGRFYPDYFNTLNNVWGNPAGQAFAYMNQEFDNVSIDVAAYSALGNETQNYGSFNTIQQAFFELDEGRLLNGNRLNLTYRGSRGAINNNDISWQKQADFSPDGPFNFDGGPIRDVSLNIFTATLSDPVQFKTQPTDPSGMTTQRLPDSQPNVVFGRVNLSDVGGVEGSSITVPLQVQYWTNGAFINNVFDSFTDIDAEMDGNPTVIWPVGGATTATLTGAADVNNGVSNNFTAQQAPNAVTREQVQIWQQLDSINNNMPWLMFDWDQDGIDEENPSTVVTFGIHRGNDRVIYRGESGLIGQQ